MCSMGINEEKIPETVSVDQVILIGIRYLYFSGTLMKYKKYS